MNKLPKLRWKKQPRETGLRAVFAGPPSHDLHDGTTVYATVSCIRTRYTVTGWMWSCGSNKELGIPWHNTAGNPKPTIEEAKTEALVFIKSHLLKP